MNRFLTVSLAALALSGCFEKTPKTDNLSKAVSVVEGLEVNSSSPDMVVKSWWRLKDAAMLVYLAECNNRNVTEEPIHRKIAELSTPDIYNGRDCAAAPDTYERRIHNVDVQSDTRAVVVARIFNTTPPDEGAVLSSEDKKGKEEGSAFQYIVERKDLSSPWKISQVSEMNKWDKEWSPIFKKPEPSTNRFVIDFQQ